MSSATDPQSAIAPSSADKPIDIGADGVCISLDTYGRLISMSAYHEEQGYGGFTVVPPFTDDMRYDQAKVRQYRASIAEQTGFGPQFSSPVRSKKVQFLGGAIPKIELDFENGGRAITALIIFNGVAIQKWCFEGVQATWEGKVSVQRAAYTQLTEGGPLGAISINQSLESSASGFYLEDADLGISFCLDGLNNVAAGQRLSANTLLNYVVDEEQQGELVLVYALGANRKEVDTKVASTLRKIEEDDFNELLEERIEVWDRYLKDIPEDPILRRGLVYARMMEIPVSGNKDASCIMTDHMLLPLSWNRDAYFVARALLDWGYAHWYIVRRHLVWMFEVADRGENNEWGRCYLLNGKLKDDAYQLDQQFFPLLELAEYCMLSDDKQTLDRLGTHVQPILDSVFQRKHPDAYLFPTEETPGDDPLPYEYHFSSHVLIWYTLVQLHKVFPERGYSELAEAVKKDTDRYLVAEHDGKSIYSYACDAKGNYLFYHDANDVPLAMAPEWGFCEANDACWRDTVSFAYSDANKDGYFGQKRLGSVHTPAPWPLGDVQLIYIARLMNNRELEKIAIKNLKSGAQWDGSLSEAYDKETYAVHSRHWFAWPSAYYAMSQLAGRTASK